MTDWLPCMICCCCGEKLLILFSKFLFPAACWRAKFWAWTRQSRRLLCWLSSSSSLISSLSVVLLLLAVLMENSLLTDSWGGSASSSSPPAGDLALTGVELGELPKNKKVFFKETFLRFLQWKNFKEQGIFQNWGIWYRIIDQNCWVLELKKCSWLREDFNKKKTVKRVTLSLLGLEPTYPT